MGFVVFLFDNFQKPVVMSKLIAIILLLLAVVSAEGQIKIDDNWILGYPPNDSILGFGGVKLNFSNDSCVVSKFETTANINASSISVSNNKGELLFFSNGCRLYDSKSRVIAGGDSLNYIPGYHFQHNCIDFPVSYWIHQGLMALPEPETDNSYFLFTLRFDNDFLKQFLFPTSLLLTKIRIEGDTLVKVISKNELLLQDTYQHYLQ